MNDTRLQKHYDKLTVKERFSAIVAAGVRGDDQERAALLSAAPRVGFTVSDTWPLSNAFSNLETALVINQLGLGWTIVFSILAIEGGCGHCRRPDPCADCELDDCDDCERPIPCDDCEHYNRIFEPLQTVCKIYLANSAAWRLVCSEYKIDPDVTMSLMPGGAGLAIAQSERLALAFLDGVDPDPAEVEAAACQIRAALEDARL